MKNTLLKKFFLIDGFGAIISAVLLGLVLTKLETYFGIPKPTLYFLATLPCIFAIYDFYCYFKINSSLDKFLKAIAIINLLYCCLSIALAIYHSNLITKLGWLYIILEIIIVTTIAFVELRVVKNYRQKK
ncbi:MULTISPECIES: hypothetical protein [Tenacibaculum]|uniref:hypothetical protein n=1 Tax=Tenacibaculum TaxID=104267 RepID=UPI001F0AFEAE|nr:MULTISPECIES: hypothetical protein [Tenacibaculum]MCH3882567.1 hypothetical protein [Tenacibaculum aquimarinum]MDO6599947.1 hypothetical protein [Tenacibaculum sp. 1_MG-2023]